MITIRKQYLMIERGPEHIFPFHYCYYYLYGLIEKFDATIDQIQSKTMGHFLHTQCLLLLFYSCLKYSFTNRPWEMMTVFCSFCIVCKAKPIVVHQYIQIELVIDR